MIPRKVASAFLMLVAVQYAGLGVDRCADVSSHTDSRIVQGPAHGEHHTKTPCDPAPQDSGSHHSTPGCLAMAGCAPAGIAAVGALQLVDPRVKVEHVARVPAPLESVSSAPETPPPIAI